MMILLKMRMFIFIGVFYLLSFSNVNSVSILLDIEHNFLKKDSAKVYKIKESMSIDLILDTTQYSPNQVIVITPKNEHYLVLINDGVKNVVLNINSLVYDGSKKNIRFGGFVEKGNYSIAVGEAHPDYFSPTYLATVIVK